MGKRGRKKAQSVLEYVIMLIAIVAAIIAAVSLFGLKADKSADETKGLGKLLFKMSDKITTESKQIADMVE